MGLGAGRVRLGYGGPAGLREGRSRHGRKAREVGNGAGEDRKGACWKAALYRHLQLDLPPIHEGQRVGCHWMEESLGVKLCRFCQMCPFQSSNDRLVVSSSGSWKGSDTGSSFGSWYTSRYLCSIALEAGKRRSGSRASMNSNRSMAARKAK